MTTKLFVGKLPYSTTSEELERLFATVGTVQSAKVITDKFSGQSKGFGFVEMSSVAEAQNALSLNNSLVGDRAIVVSEAKPQETRPPGHWGNNGGGGSRSGGGSRY